jgi:hypothetical protein
MAVKKSKGKGSKPLTGSQLYNRIYSDIKKLNEGFLPPDRKVLSDKEARTFASKVFQEYKDVPKSKLRIGSIQETIVTDYPKAKKSKKLSYKNLYGKILTATKEYNESLPNKQQLTNDLRRKIASTIYPEFRLKSLGRIRLADIRKAVKKNFTATAKDTIISPLAIPQQRLSGINYFEIDHEISQLVPECIDVIVEAGKFGTTKMFNTKDYNYERSGVKQIVENIRDTVKDKYDDAVFYGFKKLKDGKEDDLTPEHYYIHFVLNFNNVDLGDTSEAIYPTNKQVSGQEQKSARKILNERLKNMKLDKASKRKLKREAKKVAEFIEKEQEKKKKLNQQQKERKKKITIEQKLLQEKKITKSQQKTIREQSKTFDKNIKQANKRIETAYTIATNAIELAYKSGAITRAQYTREMNKLKSLKK